MTTTARPAEFRYGVVLVLVLAVVALLIVAPAGDWTYACAFALESAALVVAIATSRARADVRRVRSAAVTLFAVAWVLAVAAGALPQWLVPPRARGQARGGP